MPSVPSTSSASRTARRERLELVYGAMLRRHPDGSTAVLGRFPPENEQFGLQSTLYHAGVAEIFELELTDWLFDLPYDWGICQRMMRAGVRMGMVDEVSVDYFPSQWWTPRDEASPPPAPEWQFVPEGWELASQEDHPCARGWDVEEVARTYAERWPAFEAAVSGAKPLGVVHEIPLGAEMSNDSLVAHNAALTLAYVLARTARATDSLSVLDWGGALGHQQAIARGALPEISSIGTSASCLRSVVRGGGSPLRHLPRERRVPRARLRPRARQQLVPVRRGLARASAPAPPAQRETACSSRELPLVDGAAELRRPPASPGLRLRD